MNPPESMPIEGSGPLPGEVGPAATPDSPGLRLRKAREAMGQSAADIAARLRMGVKQVQALESGDYASLPTGTFLRGFVRNYANAVGADAESVLGLLEVTHAPAKPVAATSVVEPTRQKMTVREPAGVLASAALQGVIALVVVAALAGAAWYWIEMVRPNPGGIGKGSPATSLTQAAAPVVQPKVEPISVVSTPPPEVPATAPPVEPAFPPAQGAAPAAPPPAPPKSVAPVESAAGPKTVDADKKPRPPGASVIGFTFSGESWVEVTDANGRIVLSKRYREGEADEVAGKGPLAVVIGNASATRMAVNGREFDLAPHTRGAVARVSTR